MCFGLRGGSWEGLPSAVVLLLLSLELKRLADDIFHFILSEG